MYRRRNSLRWAGYDYSKEGWYFVTVCIKGMKEWFGECAGGEMGLNLAGRVVERQISWLSEQYEYVEIDEYIVMPNHVHMILVIRRGGINPARTDTLGLSEIVRRMKARSSCEIRKIESGFQWHRSFYDRVIRDDQELAHIREYIRNNPGNWKLDKYYP